jgi:hypothetical protein
MISYHTRARGLTIIAAVGVRRENEVAAAETRPLGTIAGGHDDCLQEASTGRSNIHAEKMAGDATGARIDLNTVATTVVSVATSLTRSRHSRRK